MYRVLIVDDEQPVLDGLERQLNKIPGIQVVEKIQSGTEAKEYLEKHAVDAVFSDICMPVLDGLELTGWLASRRPECDVVLISAYADFSYAKKAMMYGVKHYLTKPIRLPEVKKVIEKLVQERNQRERNMLWNRNLQKEIQELEIYHALIDSSDPVKVNLNKKLYYAEYTVRIDENVNINAEMLQAGWTNVFRWCGPLCIPVLAKQRKKEFDYLLLAEEEEQFPGIEELKERAENLMLFKSSIERNKGGGARELIQSKLEDLAQDSINDKIIVKAQEYIKQNLADNISRTEVAEAVYMDSAYFSRYFKKKTGMNFHDYLQQERMNKVVTLLEKGEKVWDAAKQAGYQSRKYFNQVFKLYMGCSPSEYRRSKRGTES